MTEQQPYDVIARLPGFELRRMPAHLVAEINVDGTFESAGNKAFRPLAGFIGGRNASSRKIAMTAPVNQESADDTGTFVVGFVMPADLTEETLPAPDDPRVELRRVPAQVAAASRFTGRWKRKTYEEKAARLLREVKAAGFEVAGPVRFARYNPPTTPWFLRRNEVVVPVKGQRDLAVRPEASHDRPR